jgi:phage shock protein PspC (stress-responsive transcriptional regulator)
MSTSTPPPAPPVPPRPVGATFFAWLRSLGVTRRDDAWVAGVCSGIAARTGLDPLLVRGIAIVIALLGGPVFLAYAVGWALLPDARGHIHAESAVNGVFTFPMIFIGLAAVLTFLPFMRGIWFDGAPDVWGMPDWLEVTLRTLWVLALIAGAIWLTVAIARSVPRGAGWPAAGTDGSAPTGPGGTGAPGGSGYDTGTPASSSFPAGAYGYATGTYSAPSAPTAAPFGPGSDQGTPAAASAAPSGTAPGSAPHDPAASAWSAHPAWTTASGTRGPDDRVQDAARERQQQAQQAARERHLRAQEAARERNQQAQEAARARAEAWRAAHPRPQGVGAAFASVVLGIALLAAALTGIACGAVVPDGKLVLVISIAALAVIAIGIVIAGIRGRQSGGLGPFAFLLAIVVLFTGVVPAGTEVLPFGTQNVDAAAALSTGPDSYLLIAGKTVVDADELTTTAPGGTVDVWLGAGQSEVLVPDGVRFRVESHVLAGTVTSSLGTERSGIFIDDDRMFTVAGPEAGRPVSDAGSASAEGDDLPVLRIWMLAGNVKLVTESER